MILAVTNLSMALEGRFGDHHGLMRRLRLDHTGHLETMITRLDAQIEAMMRPFQAARDLLAATPGTGQPAAAAAVISGIGTGVREYFPGDAHLASWTGLCPGNHESAGKRRGGKRRKATRTCNLSWPSAPGPRSATTATSSPPATGT